MILRLYLSDKSTRDVAASTVHDPEAGRTELAVDWPADLDGRSVIGFTLTASTDPLVLNSGDTLMLPLPPVIAVEP